jgi:hypothetical protein
MEYSTVRGQCAFLFSLKHEGVLSGGGFIFLKIFILLIPLPSSARRIIISFMGKKGLIPLPYLRLQHPPIGNEPQRIRVRHVSLAEVDGVRFPCQVVHCLVRLP